MAVNARIPWEECWLLELWASSFCWWWFVLWKGEQLSSEKPVNKKQFKFSHFPETNSLSCFIWQHCFFLQLWQRQTFQHADSTPNLVSELCDLPIPMQSSIFCCNATIMCLCQFEFFFIQHKITWKERGEFELVSTHSLFSQKHF